MQEPWVNETSASPFYLRRAMLWLFYQEDEDTGPFLVYVRLLSDNEWLCDQTRNAIKDRIIEEISSRTGRTTKAIYHAPNRAIEYSTTSYLRSNGTTDVYHSAKKVF